MLTTRAIFSKTMLFMLVATIVAAGSADGATVASRSAARAIAATNRAKTTANKSVVSRATSRSYVKPRGVTARVGVTGDEAPDDPNPGEPDDPNPGEPAVDSNVLTVTVGTELYKYGPMKKYVEASRNSTTNTLKLIWSGPDDNEKYTLPDLTGLLTNVGYQLNVTGDVGGYYNSNGSPKSRSSTSSPQFELEIYTGGGDNPSNCTIRYDCGEHGSAKPVDLTQPISGTGNLGDWFDYCEANTGYDFVGWTIGDDPSGQLYDVDQQFECPTSGDTYTATAQWQDMAYFSCGGGTGLDWEIPCDDIETNGLPEVEGHCSAPTGSTFDSWKIWDGDQYDEGYSIGDTDEDIEEKQVNARWCHNNSHKITAVWKQSSQPQQSCEISYNCGTGYESTIEQNDVIQYGDGYTIADFSDVCEKTEDGETAEFVHWKVGEEEKAPGEEVTCEGSNITLIASTIHSGGNEGPCDVTFVCPDGTSNEPMTLSFGQGISLGIDDYHDCEFGDKTLVSWNVNNKPKESFTCDGEDVTVIAQWTQNCTIKYHCSSDESEEVPVEPNDTETFEDVEDICGSGYENGWKDENDQDVNYSDWTCPGHGEELKLFASLNTIPKPDTCPRGSYEYSTCRDLDTSGKPGACLSFGCRCDPDRYPDSGSNKCVKGETSNGGGGGSDVYELINAFYGKGVGGSRYSSNTQNEEQILVDGGLCVKYILNSDGEWEFYGVQECEGIE